MWLLNTSTQELEEFFDGQTPFYAILSHRWEKEEVLFRDFQSGTHNKERIGFAKISNCCKLAQKSGLTHVWIDTCCIDKSSSAELSEAINSMYRWYQKALVCYAYLSDVDITSKATVRAQMAQSAWFTRGWTLQELLAPRKMVFLDRNWRAMGEKKELSELITSITGISSHALENISIASVAMKLSWASKRTTTRIEDMAYSLIGLFNVSMPLLYGEGLMAFRRFQLEVLQTTEDDSILAWGIKQDGRQLHDDPKYVHLMDSEYIRNSLLAPTPHYFAESGDLQKVMLLDRPPYSVTHRGLTMNTHLIKFSKSDPRGFIPLNCARITKQGPVPLVIGVTENPYGGKTYRRRSCSELYLGKVFVNLGNYFDQGLLDSTARFLKFLQNQPLQTIYINLAFDTSIYSLRLADINWAKADPELAMKQLGIVPQKDKGFQLPPLHMSSKKNLAAEFLPPSQMPFEKNLADGDGSNYDGDFDHISDDWIKRGVRHAMKELDSVLRDERKDSTPSPQSSDNNLDSNNEFLNLLLLMSLEGYFS